MDNTDTKHLYRKTGRNIWTIRYVLPIDVLPAFVDSTEKPRKEITKSTETDDLYTAQQLRNVFIGELKIKIQSIRTNDEELMVPLAKMYAKKIKQFNIEEKQMDHPHPAIDEIRDEALARLKEMKLVKATGEEITKAMTTPEGYITEEEALEKLDKTGKVKQFYAEILGHNFDAHLDHWETRRSKKVGASFMKQGRAHIRLFQKYHPTISGITWKVVDDWIYELSNPEKGKPINSITIGGYLSSLRNYWNHVSRIIQDPNAKDLIAFKEHELPDSFHDIRK